MKPRFESYVIMRNVYASSSSEKLKSEAGNSGSEAEGIKLVRF